MAELNEPQILSTEDKKALSPRKEKDALLDLSKDPAGLQVFMDKMENDKLSRKVDIVNCISLHMKGVSYSDIAKTQGLSGTDPSVKRWLAQHIAKYKPDIDTLELEVYKGFRTEYLIQKQKEILDGITPLKIDSASLSELTSAHDRLFQNERLNENKATSNIAHQFSSIVEDIHKTRAQEDDDGQ